jgi:hypothetical protein
MPTVHHPTIPDVTLEVADDKLDDHLAQGWILTPVDADEPHTFEVWGDRVQTTEPFNASELPTGLNTITDDTGEPEQVEPPRRRRDR